MVDSLVLALLCHGDGFFNVQDSTERIPADVKSVAVLLVVLIQRAVAVTVEMERAMVTLVPDDQREVEQDQLLLAVVHFQVVAQLDMLERRHAVLRDSLVELSVVVAANHDDLLRADTGEEVGDRERRDRHGKVAEMDERVILLDLRHDLFLQMSIHRLHVREVTARIRAVLDDVLVSDVKIGSDPGCHDCLLEESLASRVGIAARYT